jgi:hypothetical protein
VPRRVMTFGKITINESRIKDSEFDLDDIRGIDLLEEFSTWCGAVPKSHFTDTVKQTYGTKPVVDRYSRFSVVAMRTGHFGTDGNLVINIRNHGTKYKTDEDDSSTVETRCGLLVPPKSKVGLFFVEHQGHDACGSRIFSSFETHLKDKAERTMSGTRRASMQLVVKRETLVSGEAWIEAADLERITALKYDKPTDISEEIVETPLTYSRTIEPPKGVRKLSNILKGRVFDGTVHPTSQLGFPTDEEYDDLVVSLGDGERRKQMVIGREKSPAIRKMLNDDGQQALTTTQLISSFEEDAKDFFEGLDLSWSYGWTRK